MRSRAVQERDLAALQVLESALQSEAGVEVPVIDASLDMVRQQLYRMRKTNLQRYGLLSIIASPRDPNNTLWVVKRKEPEYASEE